MPIRAVIFDFNGTLSQDEPVLCRIYRELFAEYGKPISEREYYERLSGLAEHTIAELCLGPGDPRIPAFIRERIDRYRALVADGSTVPEATRDAVRFAAERARLAIVSGAAREEIVPVVAAAGLGELFATVVADDDVALGKPDPESYLLALRAARRRRRGDARLRGHRGRGRVREGGRHACGRPARDAGARAARAGRRGGGDDRRPVAPALARMTWTIAHRGASAELPENTPAAFERAIELGADFVEFDVHAAADGSLVVCHDPPVGGEPRLEEVVDQCAGRIGLMCELKSPWRYRRHDVVARTVALLPEDAVVVCFESRALQQVRGLRTLQHVGLGVSIRRAARSAWGVGFWDPRARRSRTRAGSAAGTEDRPSTRSTTSGGCASSPALGVDGIFTDRPRAAAGDSSEAEEAGALRREARPDAHADGYARRGSRRRRRSSRPRRSSPSAASRGRGTCARSPRP